MPDHLTREQLQDVLQFAEALYVANNMGAWNPYMSNQLLQGLNSNPRLPSFDKIHQALQTYKDSEQDLQGFTEFMSHFDMIFERTLYSYANTLAFDLSYVCTNAFTESDYQSEEYEADKRRVFDFLDKFKYQQEFRNVVVQCLKNETYFTWFRKTKWGNKGMKLALQVMPQDYCMLTGYWENGLLWDFDFTYFLQAGVDIEGYDPAIIKQYFGVSSEDELKDMLSLEYKRNLAIEDYVESTITDDEINKYYDDEVVGDMKVRHILIKPDTNSDMSTEETTEAEEKAKEEAEEIIKKLDEGEDFASLAKEYSDDTGSASDGGLIDYFNKDDNMEEAFLKASIELEVGKYTEEPVKSSYGYHIILKEDQKDKPKLEEVEDDIRKTLAEEKLNDDATLIYNALIEIRKNAGVEFKDDSLKKDYDELMEQLIENASNSSNA